MELAPYLAAILKSLTAKQREAVLLTLAAEDGRVPNTVHARTLDALVGKRVFREVENKHGGFNWCVLTYGGKRIARVLAEQAALKASADAVAASKHAPALDRQAAAEAAATGLRLPTVAELRGIVTGTETEPRPTAATVLRAALDANGVPFQEEESAMWGAVVVIRFEDAGTGTGTLEIADRGWSIGHAPDTHTGWSIFRRDADGEFVPTACEPLYISGDGTTVVDCATDTTAAVDAILDVLTAAPAPAAPTAGDLMLAALAGYGIRAIQDEVSIAVPLDQGIDLDWTLHHDRIVIADRNPWYGHAPAEHTGWVVDIYNPDNEPVSDAPPIHIAGDDRDSLVDCVADCAAAAAAIADFLTA